MIKLQQSLQVECREQARERALPTERHSLNKGAVMGKEREKVHVLK